MPKATPTYRIEESGIIHDSRVHYLDLTASADDKEFPDDGHPRPEFAAKWTAPLLLFINGLSAQNHRARKQADQERRASVGWEF